MLINGTVKILHTDINIIINLNTVRTGSSFLKNRQFETMAICYLNIKIQLIPCILLVQIFCKIKRDIECWIC